MKYQTSKMSRREFLKRATAIGIGMAAGPSVALNVASAMSPQSLKDKISEVTGLVKKNKDSHYRDDGTSVDTYMKTIEMDGQDVIFTYREAPGKDYNDMPDLNIKKIPALVQEGKKITPRKGFEIQDRKANGYINLNSEGKYEWNTLVRLLFDLGKGFKLDNRSGGLVATCSDCEDQYGPVKLFEIVDKQYEDFLDKVLKSGKLHEKGKSIPQSSSQYGNIIK